MNVNDQITYYVTLPMLTPVKNKLKWTIVFFDGLNHIALNKIMIRLTLRLPLKNR